MKKEFIEREWTDDIEGTEDNDGFFYTPNGSFWDPDYVYFNKEGFDKHGGFYDESHNYVPGKGWDEINKCYYGEIDEETDLFEDDEEDFKQNKYNDFDDDDLFEEEFLANDDPNIETIQVFDNQSKNNNSSNQKNMNYDNNNNGFNNYNNLISNKFNSNYSNNNYDKNNNNNNNNKPQMTIITKDKERNNDQIKDLTTATKNMTVLDQCNQTGTNSLNNNNNSSFNKFGQESQTKINCVPFNNKFKETSTKQANSQSSINHQIQSNMSILFNNPYQPNPIMQMHQGNNQNSFQQQMNPAQIAFIQQQQNYMQQMMIQQYYQQQIAKQQQQYYNQMNNGPQNNYHKK